MNNFYNAKPVFHIIYIYIYIYICIYIYIYIYMRTYFYLYRNQVNLMNQQCWAVSQLNTGTYWSSIRDTSQYVRPWELWDTRMYHSENIFWVNKWSDIVDSSCIWLLVYIPLIISSINSEISPVHQLYTCLRLLPSARKTQDIFTTELLHNFKRYL